MRELHEHPAPPPLTGGLAATDVFLSYSRADTDAVLRLRAALKSAGLATFLDRDQLPAGQPWLTALEHGIAGCGAVAVLVGPAGLGTVQQREVQLALDRQIEEERRSRVFPVIPVILPGVGDPPGGFLKLQTWVDLRADPDDPGQLDLLLKGIRGQPVAGAPLREAICPYRGLLAFREEDAGLFFGREAEVAGLVEKVRHEPLLTLIGRSGSGKSSVVYAGLIPALRRGTDGRNWAVVTFRPGDAPLHALVRAFYTPPAELTPFELDRKIKDQVAILRADPEALADRVRGLLASEEERGTDRLLLYVDQWEELYTQALLHPALTPEQAEADITRFVDLLLHAARTSPCTVVLTARADFYADLLRHGGLAAAMPPGLVNLGPLSGDDLARAIREPATAVGLTVDGPLVETLLDAVAGDSGKLPLLEYALKETWQHSRNRQPRDTRLSLDDYGAAGGIDGAIAQRADDLYAGLDEAGKAVARRLFVSLVTPGEGREDTRARVALPDDPAMAAVVRTFSGAEARLLVTGDQAVPDGAAAGRLVEISHETLIREWQPLKDWVAANRETLRRLARVRALLADWEQGGRDPSLLLPPGLALEVGRKLLDDHGDVLIDEVRPYVEASLAADQARRRREAEAVDAERRRELAAAQQFAEEQRKRTRLAWAFTAGAALLAVIAGWQAWEARQQRTLARAERDNAAAQSYTAEVERNKAERNLSAAARAANGLVFDLAQGLRAVSGVSIETIRLILERADTLLADLAPGDDAPPELRRIRSVALIEFATTYLTQGDLEAAQAAAEQSRAIIAKLAAADPGNAQWQRDLSVSWNKLGDVRQAQGDLPGALQAYTESKNIRDKLAAADPGNAEWQGDLSFSWEKLGDLRVAQGDRPGALQAFTESKRIIAKLAAADPGNAQWQRDQYLILFRLGDLKLSRGNLPDALTSLQAGHDIIAKLAAADPGNAQWQRDLSFSWNKLGDLRVAQGDLPGALQAFTEDMNIAAKLAAADPGNAEWQRDLSISWSKLGDLRVAQGDLPGALQAFAASKNIADQLAAADPANAQWQRDLSVSWNKLGDVRQAQGDLPGALQAFTEAKNIADKLAAADPGNAEWQRDLSVSWEKLGDVRQAQGDLPGALQALTESKSIRDKLAAADPGNAQWQRDLYAVLWRVGDIKLSRGNLPDALTSLQAGHDIIAKLAAADPANAQWQRDLSFSWNKLGDLRVAQGDLPGALQAFAADMEITAKLAAADPGNAQWQRDLIVSHWKLADLLERMPDRAPDAAGHWTQALDIARTLADTGRLAPTDAYFVETLEQRLAAAPTAPDPPP